MAVKHMNYVTALQAFERTSDYLVVYPMTKESFSSSFDSGKNRQRSDERLIAQNCFLYGAFPEAEHSGGLWGVFWLLCQLLHFGGQQEHWEQFRYCEVFLYVSCGTACVGTEIIPA